MPLPPDLRTGEAEKPNLTHPRAVHGVRPTDYSRPLAVLQWTKRQPPVVIKKGK